MRFLRHLILALASLSLLGFVALLALYLYLQPKLPDVEVLRDVQLQQPLRVYGRDGALLAQFGEKYRTPVAFDQVPTRMVQAFLAAEDDRFYEHPGVDYQGLLRAAYQLALTGEKRQGGSTITMQLARNFFLSGEKTYLRKVTEILLALQIERSLDKNEILTLYLNKIYLGHRAYGVAAAAEVYFGRRLDELTLPEIAMIAGLPKAPSALNPLSNPERALERRNYVLGRMWELGFLDEVSYQEALAAPNTAALQGLPIEVEAGYVAELARQALAQALGEDEIYVGGYKVYTTLDSRMQAAAVQSLRDGLHAYSERHGYRGPLWRVGHSEQPAPALDSLPAPGDLRPARVLALGKQEARLAFADGDEVRLDWAGIQWAAPRRDNGRPGPAPGQAADVLQVGDLVQLRPQGDGWRLAQQPLVQGALVAQDPRDGAILALNGGFDFHSAKYNRAVQARRQPGSSLKPFIYSAALEQGLTAASMINDAPLVIADPAIGTDWRPENYSGRFHGPTRLREGLIHSRNLISIRLLEQIGVTAALEHLERFGLPVGRMPRNLSLALGTATLSPLELATAYSVFANAGYRVHPYLIDSVLDGRGEILLRTRPTQVCESCTPEVAAASPDAPDPGLGAVDLGTRGLLWPEPLTRSGLIGPPAPSGRVAPRVIEARNAWLMDSLMRDVIRRGTGRRALQLKRDDLAGKTGTTNDQRDAWFAGYGTDLVAVAWVGFDEMTPLGQGETGGRAALPIWMDFMRVALQGRAARDRPAPPGMVQVRIDAQTGRLAGRDTRNSVFETFRRERVPEPAPVRVDMASELDTDPSQQGSEGIVEPLF